MHKSVPTYVIYCYTGEREKSSDLETTNPHVPTFTWNALLRAVPLTSIECSYRVIARRTELSSSSLYYWPSSPQLSVGASGAYITCLNSPSNPTQNLLLYYLRISILPPRLCLIDRPTLLLPFFLPSSFITTHTTKSIPQRNPLLTRSLTRRLLYLSISGPLRDSIIIARLTAHARYPCDISRASPRLSHHPVSARFF